MPQPLRFCKTPSRLFRIALGEDDDTISPFNESAAMTSEQRACQCQAYFSAIADAAEGSHNGLNVELERQVKVPIGTSRCTRALRRARGYGRRHILKSAANRSDTFKANGGGINRRHVKIGRPQEGNWQHARVLDIQRIRATARLDVQKNRCRTRCEFLDSIMVPIRDI